jgi:small subunit ribosomal protein S9
LQLIGKDKDYDISLHVDGGGLAGQVDSCKLAISKALSTMNEDLRGTLKKAGLLKRDPREKEPKKYGLRKARKREQFSKR